MTIITISRGSYSKGKEIAEKVASRLGYECIRREIILETSQHYHIPEIKLARAIHDAPSILERFGYRKEKYVTFFQQALLDRVKDADVVYHGLAGQFLLTGISHVLKVRVIADMEDRIREEMEREGIEREEAAQILRKDDEERRKWSQYLYGIDSWDPWLYDLVVHIKKITVEMAVDVICHTAQMKEFQVTPESARALANLELATEVKAALVVHLPYVEVTAEDGNVHVKARGHLSQEKLITKEIQDIVGTVRGVKKLYVDISPVMS